MTTATETGPQWIRRLYRLADLEPGLRILAQGFAAKRADADIFALAERCEAAAKRFDVVSDAYDDAENAEPHDQAADDEAFRLQGVALDEFRDAALPLIGPGLPLPTVFSPRRGR
jgi:hypothetical protein